VSLFHMISPSADSGDRALVLSAATRYSARRQKHRLYYNPARLPVGSPEDGTSQFGGEHPCVTWMEGRFPRPIRRTHPFRLLMWNFAMLESPSYGLSLIPTKTLWSSRQAHAPGCEAGPSCRAARRRYELDLNRPVIRSRLHVRDRDSWSTLDRIRRQITYSRCNPAAGVCQSMFQGVEASCRRACTALVLKALCHSCLLYRPNSMNDTTPCKPRGARPADGTRDRSRNWESF